MRNPEEFKYATKKKIKKIYKKQSNKRCEEINMIVNNIS